MSVPSPALMARFIKPAPAPVVVAQTEPEALAKIVRPGTREVIVESAHDGVVKAKHLKAGQEVRAWLHGKPCGGVRTVASVTRSEDGADVIVEFSSAHPTTTYKAAYRFHDASLVGTVVQQRQSVPALVAYEEV